MDAYEIVLWWYDKNGATRHDPHNVVLEVNYRAKTFKLFYAYVNYYDTRNAVEVVRKTDLKEYVNTLKRMGFKQLSTGNAITV